MSQANSSFETPEKLIEMAFDETLIAFFGMDFLINNVVVIADLYNSKKISYLQMVQYLDIYRILFTDIYNLLLESTPEHLHKARDVFSNKPKYRNLTKDGISQSLNSIVKQYRDILIIKQSRSTRKLIDIHLLYFKNILNVIYLTFVEYLKSKPAVLTDFNIIFDTLEELFALGTLDTLFTVTHIEQFSKIMNDIIILESGKDNPFISLMGLLARPPSSSKKPAKNAETLAKENENRRKAEEAQRIANEEAAAAAEKAAIAKRIANEEAAAAAEAKRKINEEIAQKIADELLAAESTKSTKLTKAQRVAAEAKAKAEKEAAAKVQREAEAIKQREAEAAALAKREAEAAAKAKRKAEEAAAKLERNAAEAKRLAEEKAKRNADKAALKEAKRRAFEASRAQTTSVQAPVSPTNPSTNNSVNTLANTIGVMSLNNRELPSKTEQSPIMQSQTAQVINSATKIPNKNNITQKVNKIKSIISELREARPNISVKNLRRMLVNSNNENNEEENNEDGTFVSIPHKKSAYAMRSQPTNSRISAALSRGILPRDIPYFYSDIGLEQIYKILLAHKNYIAQRLQIQSSDIIVKKTQDDVYLEIVPPAMGGAGGPRAPLLHLSVHGSLDPKYNRAINGPIHVKNNSTKAAVVMIPKRTIAYSLDIQKMIEEPSELANRLAEVLSELTFFRGTDTGGTTSTGRSSPASYGRPRENSFASIGSRGSPVLTQGRSMASSSTNSSSVATAPRQNTTKSQKQGQLSPSSRYKISGVASYKFPSQGSTSRKPSKPAKGGGRKTRRLRKRN